MSEPEPSAIVSAILQSPAMRRIIEECVRPVPVTREGSTSATIAPSTPTLRPRLERNPPPAAINEEIRRNFPSVGSRVAASRQIRTRSRSPQSRNNRGREPSRTFTRDVILVRNPQQNSVLTGRSRRRAYERGFALSEVTFHSNWNFQEIKHHICQLFPDQLTHVRFEILVLIGGQLVLPNLPQNEELTGEKLKRIFNQRAVYVRPTQSLSHTHINVDESNTVEIVATISNAETDACIDLLPHTDTDCNNGLAMANGLDDMNPQSSSLEDILKKLKNKIDLQKTTFINTYRKDHTFVFESFIRAVNRKHFEPFHKLSVKFTDTEGTADAEGAVGMEGPKREMFRILFQGIKDSGMFFGNIKKNLRFDQDLLKKRRYYEAGRAIALGIIHAECSPHFFSGTLYSALVTPLNEVVPELEDVEFYIKQKLQALMEMSNLEEMQTFVASQQIFSIAGIHLLRKREDLNGIIIDTLKFYAIERMRPALEQLIQGLQTANLHEMMCQRPELWKKLFCSQKAKLTASVFNTVFRIELSEFGSDKRKIESMVLCFWRDFLLDCEDDDDVQLKDVLIFISGADEVPILGFPKTAKICFSHEEGNRFPKANTCSVELYLPVIHKSYEMFKFHMNSAVLNCRNFGFA